jgi:hypothetical protein
LEEAQMALKDFFLRFPAVNPILLQGITEPSLVIVAPEKPALQPERVRLHPKEGLASKSVPARGSPETTSKDGLFSEMIS